MGWRVHSCRAQAKLFSLLTVLCPELVWYLWWWCAVSIATTPLSAGWRDAKHRDSIFALPSGQATPLLLGFAVAWLGSCFPLVLCACVCLPLNTRPIFDVADEYTELLARQFVVLLGTAVFPLITVLACLNLTFEYVVRLFPCRPCALESARECGGAVLPSLLPCPRMCIDFPPSACVQDVH